MKRKKSYKEKQEDDKYKFRSSSLVVQVEGQDQGASPRQSSALGLSCPQAGSWAVCVHVMLLFMHCSLEGSLHSIQ